MRESVSEQTLRARACILTVRNWDGFRAMLEVLITERRPTKWEWRVCDRQGLTILNGFGTTRRGATYRGNRALFHLLAFGWDR
jgi:hypothetical protein